MPAITLQSYPNPFNPSTTVSYSVNRAGWTTLEVLDINGRVVTNLVDGAKSAGNYSATWDASAVPAGTYILRLQAGEESVEKTVTLVK